MPDRCCDEGVLSLLSGEFDKPYPRDDASEQGASLPLKLRRLASISVI
jgi:hypothetical protein